MKHPVHHITIDIPVIDLEFDDLPDDIKKAIFHFAIIGAALVAGINDGGVDLENICDGLEQMHLDVENIDHDHEAAIEWLESLEEAMVEVGELPELA